MASETNPTVQQTAGGGTTSSKPELTEERIAELSKNPEEVARVIGVLLRDKQAANEEAKQHRLKIEAFEQKERDAEQARLKEQGKFEELGNTIKAEKEQLRKTFEARLIELTLKTEAIRAGILDPDGVVMADRTALKVSKDFEVTGAAESIKDLKDKKPYLFGEPKEGAPAPVNPKPAPRGKDNADFGSLTPEELISKGLEKKKP